MPKMEVTIKALVDVDEVEHYTDLELIEYIGTDEHSVILLSLEKQELEETPNGRMKEQLDQAPMWCDTCNKETDHDVWGETDEECGLISHWRCGECGSEDADK